MTELRLKPWGRRVLGFTLVEVVVALAVLGLLLASLVVLQAASYRDREKAAGLLLAVRLADGKVEELLTRRGRPPAHREGSFPGHPGYSWRVLRRERRVTEELQMEWIELGVTYPVPNGEEEFTVSVWLAPRQ